MLLRMITDVTARIGETMQLWCSYEFRMVEMADRYCGTSSIMSQKKLGNILFFILTGASSFGFTARREEAEGRKVL